MAQPQLRKGRIVHYVHGDSDPYPGCVDPAIVLRVIAADRSLVALSVFGEHGPMFRDAVRVADGPSSAVHGGAFWPDLNAEADVDIVVAEAVELPEGGGEVPVEVPMPVEQASVEQPSTEPVIDAPPDVPEPPDLKAPEEPEEPGEPTSGTAAPV